MSMRRLIVFRWNSLEKLVNFGNKKLETLGNEEKTITAVGKFAYRRDEGDYVVSIGCLKDKNK